jgi:hypothetical protein
MVGVPLQSARHVRRSVELPVQRLIAGGLLVTTFTLYVGHDLRGIGESSRGTRIVTTALAIMGIMLACVGSSPST